VLAFLAETYDTILAVISYHTWWPSGADPFYLANIAENTVRINHYGVNYTPDSWFDGTLHGEWIWTTWESKVLSRYSVASPLEIHLDATLAEVPMGGRVTATVLQTEPSVPSDLRLRFAVTESALGYGGEEYEDVFRDMFPDVAGVSIVTIFGDSITESADFIVSPEWDLANSEIVVFVQSDVTREVVQAAKMDVPLDVPYCRAVGVVVNDSGGDGDGRAEGGETVDLVITIENGEGWLDATNVFAVLRTDDADVTVTDSTAAFPDLPAGSSGYNEGDDLTISVAPGAEPHLARFELEISTDPPNFAPTDSFSLIIGHPAVMLIDDDGGGSLEEEYRTILADSLHLFHDEWSVAEQGSPDGAWLANSQVVIWFTGTDTATTLGPDDIVALSSYLDQGGALFINGSGIGRDIGSGPFYADYLHSTYVGTTADYVVRGVPGHPIVGDSMLVLLWTEPKEIILPATGGDAMLYYDQGGDAAVTYDDSYQVVYLGFRFEAIEEGAPVGIRKYELMGRILNWMGIVGVGDKGEEGGFALGEPPRLLAPNRPNPFPDATTIQYVVPGRSSGRVPVRLMIYNILGQRVRTLVDRELTPGAYTVTWDGRDSAGIQAGSGIYFCRLEAGEASDVRKLVRMRGTSSR